MKIKLKKQAQWSGSSHRAKTSHDVVDWLAKKLIARGLAEEVTDEPEAPAEEPEAEEESTEAE